MSSMANERRSIHFKLILTSGRDEVMEADIDMVLDDEAIYGAWNAYDAVSQTGGDHMDAMRAAIKYFLENNDA